MKKSYKYVIIDYWATLFSSWKQKTGIGNKPRDEKKPLNSFLWFDFEFLSSNLHYHWFWWYLRFTAVMKFSLFSLTILFSIFEVFSGSSRGRGVTGASKNKNKTYNNFYKLGTYFEEIFELRVMRMETIRTKIKIFLMIISRYWF